MSDSKLQALADERLLVIARLGRELDDLQEMRSKALAGQELLCDSIGRLQHQLAGAREEGAAGMRERAAQLVLDRSVASVRAVETAAAIRALPIGGEEEDSLSSMSMDTWSFKVGDHVIISWKDSPELPGVVEQVGGDIGDDVIAVHTADGRWTRGRRYGGVRHAELCGQEVDALWCHLPKGHSGSHRL